MELTLVSVRAPKTLEDGSSSITGVGFGAVFFDSAAGAGGAGLLCSGAFLGAGGGGAAAFCSSFLGSSFLGGGGGGVDPSGGASPNLILNRFPPTETVSPSFAKCSKTVPDSGEFTWTSIFFFAIFVKSHFKIRKRNQFIIPCRFQS
jgi:hypothetical protein